MKRNQTNQNLMMAMMTKRLLRKKDNNIHEIYNKEVHNISSRYTESKEDESTKANTENFKSNFDEIDEVFFLEDNTKSDCSMI